ncbi:MULTISPECIES: toxin co-regulated pilus biosynthesis Q family protein [unclassified Pandoraea]|uniref:toxin co-regulated pilus biosynthesis Q family protein n=1 Tax=unclassified Pandoraea TaxID=2624094 RepID=UPI000B3F6BBE|nr:MULTISPECIES: toxin co-regulated pilus biosynthesis Q family protein [unclassified Pandoraea]
MSRPKLDFVVLSALSVFGSTVVVAHEEVPSTSIAASLPIHRPLVATARLAALPLPALTVDARDAVARTRDTPVDNDTLPAGGLAGPLEKLLAIQPSDGRVSQAIKRYAEANGWQLAWEIERDFPIEYPATFTGDFLGIIEQVVLSLQNSDAPIRVKVYEANRVLRVVHATQ